MRLFIFLLSSSFLMGSIHLPQSFHAYFIQKITNPQKKILEYRGEILFSSKANFKWYYQKPTKKEVCSDGQEIIIIDHDLEQVSFYYLENGLDMNRVLKEAKIYDESRQIYVAEYENRRYTIKLNQKKELHSLAYFDDLENKVQILFHQMHYQNKKIKPLKMLCRYPLDYDKIGEPK